MAYDAFDLTDNVALNDRKVLPDFDFFAHRSEGSWPGQLVFDGAEDVFGRWQPKDVSWC